LKQLRLPFEEKIEEKKKKKRKRRKGQRKSNPLVLPFGRYQGKTLEELVFLDYQYLLWLRKWIKEEKVKNFYFLLGRLDFLIKQAEKKRPNVLCPWCGERKAFWASLSWDKEHYDCSIGPEYICCLECRPIVRSWAKDWGLNNLEFVKLKISASSKLKYRPHQKKFLRMLKNLFGLKGASPEEILWFFKKRQEELPF